VDPKSQQRVEPETRDYLDTVFHLGAEAEPTSVYQGVRDEHDGIPLFLGRQLCAEGDRRLITNKITAFIEDLHKDNAEHRLQKEEWRRKDLPT
jgi:hypothetical protein